MADAAPAVADVFEDSIEQTGFGLYNVMILLGGILGANAVIFSTTSLSYVHPLQGCDLDLDVMQKGAMNAIVYVGMLIGSVPWALGSDILGRRNVIRNAHFLDGIFNILAALSQSFLTVLLTKLGSGICIAGAYSAIMTYIGEMHGHKYRQICIVFVGCMLSVANIILPAIALGVLTMEFRYEILQASFQPYDLFLGICALPSLACGILFCFMPESVKFQMTHGKKDEALATMRSMYHWNTLKPAEEFPVTTLGADDKLDDIETEPGFKARLFQVFYMMKAIFTPPHINIAIFVFVVEFVVLSCQNSVRLWLPETLLVLEKHTGTELTICDLFEKVTHKGSHDLPADHNCRKEHVKEKALINSMYINMASAIAFLVALVIIRFVNGKIILCVSLAATAFMIALSYFMTTPLGVGLTSAGFLVMEHISSIVLVITCVTLFPTYIRNTLMSTNMMIGRIGSVIGNMVLPKVMAQSCLGTILILSLLPTFGFICSLFIPMVPKTIA